MARAKASVEFNQRVENTIQKVQSDSSRLDAATEKKFKLFIKETVPRLK
jgi:hypothetical protein